MAEKDKINDMVDNLINQKPEQAQVDFHDYVTTKIKEITGQTNNDSDEEKDSEE